jgi:twitching motility protein PilT
MSIAMTAAEMGILVMGTLHTNGAAATIDRVVNIFPSEKQDHVRNMLSTSLRGVVSQQLMRTKDGMGRIAALEIMINTPAVANLIRQGKVEQLETVMQSSAAEGMCTMDSSIKRLFDDGKVSGEEAYLNAFDKSKFEEVKDDA